MLNLPAEHRDKPQKAGRRQETSMNHSIYSADRSTHLKIVVVALVAGIAVAGFGISARTGSDDYAQSERVARSLTGFCEFTRLFISPPKSPRGYLEDPNYPKLTTENARPPRAFS